MTRLLTASKSPRAAAAHERRDQIRWDIEPFDSIRKGIKEMQARLTILDNKFEQTQSAYNAEHEQVTGFLQIPCVLLSVLHR